MIGRIESRTRPFETTEQPRRKSKSRRGTWPAPTASSREAEALEAANRDLADALEGLKEIDRLKSEFWPP
jgi:hypothetical protein